MMKQFLLLSTLVAGASAFGVVSTPFRSQTALRAGIPEEDMSADQLEIKKIQDKWAEVRHMSKEEAESLDPEWKEAYDRFYEQYESDMVSMTEISEKLQNMIEPPKVVKKTKGQRKRDAWAKKQERAAAAAAAGP